MPGKNHTIRALVVTQLVERSLPATRGLRVGSSHRQNFINYPESKICLPFSGAAWYSLKAVDHESE